MLPKSLRLPPKEAKNIQKGKVSTKNFTAFKAPSEKKRYMIVLGKEVSWSSVRRHDLKRRISKILLENGPQKTDLVLLVRPGAGRLGARDLEKEILEIFSKK